MKRNLFCILALSLIAGAVRAQSDVEPINTGVANFLLIAPDARSAGMGGAGVALTGGNNAVFYNGAAVLFSDNHTGGVTYTFAPQMRGLDSGYSLNSLGGYYQINPRSALLGGFRYYNYPKIEFAEGSIPQSIRPKEMAIDIGYAYKLSSNLALSATLRYIHSDMGTLGGAQSAGAVVFDIGALYKRSMPFLSGANWAAGVQIANIGSKISYLETKESLPALAKLGGAVELPFSSMHKLVVTTDLGYRFTPSDVASFSASGGAEYTLMGHGMFRGGYHYGDKKKGDASYATAGAGVRLCGAQLDFSWLFAESDSPLNNSFWVSLGYSF